MTDPIDVLHFLTTGIRMLPNGTVTSTYQLILDTCGKITMSELKPSDLTLIDSYLDAQMEKDQILIDRTGTSRDEDLPRYMCPFTIRRNDSVL